MTTVVAKDVTASIDPNATNKQESTISEGVSAASPEATKDPQEQTLSPKLAMLARKEKALLAQKRALEQSRKSWEQEKAQLTAEAERAKQIRQRLKTDPYQVMLEEGLTADQAAALLLNQPNPQEQHTQLLKAELEALKAEIQSLKGGQQDAAVQNREAAKKQIFHDVSSFVEGSDQFEAIKTYGDVAKEAVVELIEKTFDAEGYVMDTEAAIKEVEEHLVEEAFKASQLKKVQSRLQPPKAETQPEAQKQQTETQKPQISTLSNRIAPSSAKPLSERERRERAIAAFKGQLQ